MAIQQKIVDKPERALNQVNTSFCLSLAAMNDKRPKNKVTKVALMGLPLLSTLPSFFGRLPIWAMETIHLEHCLLYTSRCV